MCCTCTADVLISAGHDVLACSVSHVAGCEAEPPPSTGVQGCCMCRLLKHGVGGMLWGLLNRRLPGPSHAAFSAAP